MNRLKLAQKILWTIGLGVVIPLRHAPAQSSEIQQMLLAAVEHVKPSLQVEVRTEKTDPTPMRMVFDPSPMRVAFDPRRQGLPKNVKAESAPRAQQAMTQLANVLGIPLADTADLPKGSTKLPAKTVIVRVADPERQGDTATVYFSVRNNGSSSVNAADMSGYAVRIERSGGKWKGVDVTVIRF